MSIDPKVIYRDNDNTSKKVFLLNGTTSWAVPHDFTTGQSYSGLGGKYSPVVYSNQVLKSLGNSYAKKFDEDAINKTATTSNIQSTPNSITLEVLQKAMKFYDEISPYWPLSDFWHDEADSIPTPFGEFLKQDEGKTEYHHIPWEVIEDVAEVLTEGEKKYPGENWKKCTDENRYLNALDRHMMGWRQGFRYDTESEKSHLVHAICNLLFLAQLEKDNKI